MTHWQLQAQSQLQDIGEIWAFPPKISPWAFSPELVLMRTGWRAVVSWWSCNLHRTLATNLHNSWTRATRTSELLRGGQDSLEPARVAAKMYPNPSPPPPAAPPGTRPHACLFSVLNFDINVHQYFENATPPLKHALLTTLPVGQDFGNNMNISNIDVKLFLKKNIDVKIGQHHC